MKKRQSRLLFVFGLGSLALPVSQSIWWRWPVLPGPLLMADWLDLGVTATFLAATLCALAADQHRTRCLATWELFALTLSIGVVLEGHGLHFAANAISNMGSLQGASAASTTYFLDEVLGHKILFSGLIMFFAALSWADRNRSTADQTVSRVEAALAAGGGLLAGLAFGLSLLEGQSVELSLLVMLLPMIGLRSRLTPLRLFLGVTALTCLMVIGSWHGVYGSFIEPSKARLM